MIALLPCLCGEQGQLVGSPGRPRWVGCVHCGRRTGMVYPGELPEDDEQAIESAAAQWNSRQLANVAPPRAGEAWKHQNGTLYYFLGENETTEICLGECIKTYPAKWEDDLSDMTIVIHPRHPGCFWIITQDGQILEIPSFAYYNSEDIFPTIWIRSQTSFFTPKNEKPRFECVMKLVQVAAKGLVKICDEAS